MTKFAGKVVIVTGADGVKLAQQLGADEVVDGRDDDVAQRARAFAPDGFDTARVLVGGDVQSMLSFRDISEFFLLRGLDLTISIAAGIRSASENAL